MKQEDCSDFAMALSAIAEVHNRTLTENAISIYFKLLEEFSLDEVNKAMIAHERDPENGRFFPLPAHLISHLIQKIDRPSADEMWAVIPMTEEMSVVWTREAQDAFFNAALPLIESEDKIAARMAFRASYDRLCKQNEKEKPEWIYSAGWNKDGREKVLIDAVRQKRLPINEAMRHLEFLPDERKDQLLVEFKPTKMIE